MGNTTVVPTVSSIYTVPLLLAHQDIHSHCTQYNVILSENLDLYDFCMGNLKQVSDLTGTYVYALNIVVERVEWKCKDPNWSFIQ